MKKYLKFTFILFLCLNTILNAQTKTSTIDSSIVKLHAWITFKNYAKKEKPREIYLLKGSDTIAKHNDLNDYSDGGIRNGYYWRSFWVDSLKLSDDLAFYIKKRTKSETGEVFLFNSKSTKKLAQFTESSDGYKCSVIPYYYKFITINYFNTKIATPIPINNKIDNIVAKLLYGEKKNIPLSNTKVFLVSTNGDTIRTTETNEFGDFEFMQINIQNTNIAVINNDKIKNEKEIYLAKQNGTIISTLRKTTNGFTYGGSPLMTDLCGGEHIVKVKDAENRIVTQMITMPDFTPETTYTVSLEVESETYPTTTTTKTVYKLKVVPILPPGVTLTFNIIFNGKGFSTPYQTSVVTTFIPQVVKNTDTLIPTDNTTLTNSPIFSDSCAGTIYYTNYSFAYQSFTMDNDDIISIELLTGIERVCGPGSLLVGSPNEELGPLSYIGREVKPRYVTCCNGGLNQKGYAITGPTISGCNCCKVVGVDYFWTRS